MKESTASDVPVLFRNWTNFREGSGIDEDMSGYSNYFCRIHLELIHV